MKSLEPILLTPIGVIHTPFQDPARTPIQAVRSTAEGWIEIFPEYAPGLQDVEGFSHLHLLYYFNRSRKTELQVQPFLDDQVHGIFSVRHPDRPNHLGLSVVELIGVNGNRLNIRGVDVLDGTPLLDIKPFFPEFDERRGVRAGWYESRSKE